MIYRQFLFLNFLSVNRPSKPRWPINYSELTVTDQY